MPDRLWPTFDPAALGSAIAQFERDLPGWWWSLGACSVSRDVSCGPDRQGPDAWMLRHPELRDGLSMDYPDDDVDIVGALEEMTAHALDVRACVLADEAGAAAAWAAWDAERRREALAEFGRTTDELSLRYPDPAPVVSNPRVMGGRPVFRGTRVQVEILFENLAEGYSIDEIVENFSTLNKGDLRAALLQACKMLKNAARPPVAMAADARTGRTRDTVERELDAVRRRLGPPSPDEIHDPSAWAGWQEEARLRDELAEIDRLERERRDALRHAVASARIAGVELSAETLALFDAWQAGELNDDEMMERVLAGLPPTVDEPDESGPAGPGGR